MRLQEFVKRYAQQLIALTLALAVMFFVLNWLHQNGGPVAGIAGTIGSRVSGQSYQFQ